MLIKCPECNKDVSDKAQCCIYCGFPLNKTNTNVCIINNKEFDLSDLLPQILKNDNKAQVLIQLRQKCNLQLRDAMNLYNIILQDKKIPKEYNYSIDIPTQSSNKPHCPYCNSTNLKRITTTAKAVNIAMFGLLGNKRKYQWHCNNCKTDF